MGPRPKRLVCETAVLLLGLLCAPAARSDGAVNSTVVKRIVISNTAPRFSTSGEIVNAHDGTIRWINGYFWLHAASYGAGGCADPPHHGCEQTPDHCGFQPNHNVSIWRSPDLSNASWVYVGNAVECANAPGCKILYRPHLVFNPTTKLFVLFYNYVSKEGPSRNGVATASSPAGPFTIVRPVMRTARPPLPSNHNASVGDFDVLVDSDGAAYMVYSYGPMSIEKLTPDYLDSAMVNASFAPGPVRNRETEVPEDFCEAPSLWTRNGTYFLTTGHCCCFCYQGSGMITYTAPHPLGPWVKQAGAVDLGCVEGNTSTPTELGTLPTTAIPHPGQGCSYSGANRKSVSQAQQNFVFPVETARGTEYIWTGDRWMQAPDGEKAHEPQFWGLLQFRPDGVLMPLVWQSEIVLDLLLPQPSAGFGNRLE